MSEYRYFIDQAENIYRVKPEGTDELLSPCLHGWIESTMPCTLDYFILHMRDGYYTELDPDPAWLTGEYGERATEEERQ